jgi:tRNA threonylcarbamoyladenosine biosynthesis protein TsaB
MMHLLGIDTCGPTGSVAVAEFAEGRAEIIAQTELAGRTYAAGLIPAVDELLKQRDIQLRDFGCIVVVHGPGSFTGVRVGLGAAKGLAEGAGIPVVAVSRLEVLAAKAGVPAAALDAHRHELFLRIAHPGGESFGLWEMLAGLEEMGRIAPPSRLALCDDPAAALVASIWPGVEQVRVDPPAAADALVLASPAIVARNFADVALLDGHYLRRSDAEIFGTSVLKL